FGMPYTIIGSGVMSNLDRNLHLLVGPNGSVDKFVEAVEASMPELVRTDLEKEVSNRYLSVRPQDPQVMALSELHRRHPDDGESAVSRERLESSQTQTEALLLQMKVQLARNVSN